MHEFCDDYIKPKSDKKVKLGYINRDTFIVYIKTDDIYRNIAEDVETTFDTLNHELHTPLRKRKNKKVIGLIKDKLGGKITTKFVRLRAKTYNYLIDDSSEDKKAKSTKKCVKKRKLKFKKYRIVQK